MAIVPRVGPLVRVAAGAAALLGLLAGIVAIVGQPSAGGSGPLSLPNPVPTSAVRYGGPPLKVLLVGDSLAGSLGVGLGELAAGYHVELANAGHPGCSVSMDGPIQLDFLRVAPGWPCVADDPGHLLATWRGWVEAFRPDVVVYLARSDLLNQDVLGHWTWVGRPRFDRWYAQRLRALLGVLGAGGAAVVLMTVPISQESARTPRPWDNPIRVGRLGGLLRAAAAAATGRVALYDLSRLLTPDFAYRGSVDGLPLRCADGVHLTPEAGIVVAADLFPRLWALVGRHRVRGDARWVGGPLPPSVPRWYGELACG